MILNNCLAGLAYSRRPMDCEFTSKRLKGRSEADIDYAMLVKTYESTQEETRYSPAKGTKKKTITGNPDPEHISTSFIERQNLIMRMTMRRFTRLTNGFSKKVENHAYAVAIHYSMHYNFCPNSL